MMNRTLYTLMAAALFMLPCMQGCVKDGPVVPEPEPTVGDVPIRLDVKGKEVKGAGPETRGNATVLEDIVQVGVFGYYTSDERWKWSADNKPTELSANYYGNESFVRAGNPGEYYWTPTGTYAMPPRYWPPDPRYKVSYFSYHPYNTTTSYVVPVYINTSNTYSQYSGYNTNLKGVPMIRYNTPWSGSNTPANEVTASYGFKNHIDLLRAASIDMTKNGADEIPDTDDDGIVPLTMEHALTQVKFTMRFSKPEEAGLYKFVSVDEILLSGFYDKGVMRLDNGEWDFTGQAPINMRITPQNGISPDVYNELNSITRQPVFQNPVRGLTDGNTTYELLDTANNGVPMLIPQSLENVVLTLKVTSADTHDIKGSLTVPISFDLKYTNVEWLPGHCVNYCILFMGEFIAVHTTLLPWNQSAQTTDITYVGM